MPETASRWLLGVCLPMNSVSSVNTSTGGGGARGGVGEHGCFEGTEDGIGTTGNGRTDNGGGKDVGLSSLLDGLQLVSGGRHQVMGAARQRESGLHRRAERGHDHLTISAVYHWLGRRHVQ